MQQAVTKPKKLWGNPKVFISANELIIDEKVYPLAQTHQAFVELVPEAPKIEEPPKPPADTWSSLRKTVMIVVGIFLFLLVVLFVIWWNDDYYSSSSNSRKHRLILVSDFGNVVALEHHNEKKLKEIANLVNQAVANSSPIGTSSPLR
jgi:hypothetical protein